MLKATISNIRVRDDGKGFEHDTSIKTDDPEIIQQQFIYEFEKRFSGCYIVDHDSLCHISPLEKVCSHEMINQWIADWQENCAELNLNFKANVNAFIEQQFKGAKR